MQIDYKLIGQRIKDKRKKAGFTQDFLAEKLDVSIGYISQVERGITKISLDLLARISTVLDCDIAEFVVGSAPGGNGYLSDELGEKLQRLTPKERKLLLGISELLMDNR